MEVFAALASVLVFATSLLLLKSAGQEHENAPVVKLAAIACCASLVTGWYFLELVFA